jgi:cbb3-type cytochrome oxidase subunit 3
MTTGAIVATVVMSLVFIGGLWFCFSRIGKGGSWED